MSFFSRLGQRPVAASLAFGTVTLGALAVANHLMARRAARAHPPKGAFLTIDGVRLHYTDQGEGDPVVLIHGNMVSGDDFETSGVAEILRRDHRVVIVDRPGFGHSERPRGRVWTADKQADLLHHALKRLGVVKPIVVGHSWGAIVAMAMAVRHEQDIAGVVALSGYYYWTLRPDVPLVGIAALPVIGDILRYTISPLLARMLMPVIKRALFSPGAVPARFQASFSTAMAVRPSQIRATAQDGALMIPGALALQDHYKNLALPVVVMAGDGDKVVFNRGAKRLGNAITGSELSVVRGAGHMVHHQAPRLVVDAIESIRKHSAQEKIARAAEAPAATFASAPV